MLHGESPKRIAFLRKILEEGPEGGLVPLPNEKYPAAAREGEYYLYYFDLHQPAELGFDLPEGVKFQAEIIDPWEMTITPIPGAHEGRSTLKLPGRPHQAVRFKRLARRNRIWPSAYKAMPAAARATGASPPANAA